MNLIQLFISFFKIGAFTFGGGYAMLPLIEQEVLGHGWLSAEELINFMAIAEATPGPMGINIATFVGYNVAGIIGAVIATLGVVVPSFAVILIVAKAYESFKKNKTIKKIMSGLKPAVIGLIAASSLSVFKACFTGSISNIICILLIFISTMIMHYKNMQPIIMILFSAIMSIVMAYLGFIA